MCMKEESEINNSARSNADIINDVTKSDYKYGFVTDIDTHIIPKGLNE